MLVPHEKEPLAIGNGRKSWLKSLGKMDSPYLFLLSPLSQVSEPWKA